MEPLKEISQFLDLKTRLDLKAVALQHVLSTTGSLEGREILLGIPEILRQLVLLAQDSVVAVAKDAALSLVNISADEPGASALLVISETSKPSVNEKPSDNLIDVSLRYIMDKESTLADPFCMIMSNMSRSHGLVDRIIHLIEKSNYTWDALVAAFTAQKYNNKGANLHYLGPVFSNLSQSPSVRKYLMDKERCAIQRLLPFTEYAESIVRRGGIVGTLKNCCFDEEYHEWLLSDKIDILSHLLLPLAGPEEFDEEEQDKLPVDLQFLPENKERERDSDIRLMLLEALAQLCVTRRGREILRDKNAYVILREFHKWEKDKNVLLACENVVDILIRTEEEIGLDNLKEVEVPKKYHDHFQKMDQDFINDT
ncbi:protein HGH1 homolog isoform X1 [Cephus cinctus]|uniref:Protein HGH1 homolog n=1 Tax=Cephus cinctus TaxID=211228 RepID=A0AAJ7BSV3_CEPCN|nr:protein HGH1 homolog isoform X1 [Cephus cinctus]